VLALLDFVYGIFFGVWAWWHPVEIEPQLAISRPDPRSYFQQSSFNQEI
jgi:hypothetical protein